MLCLRSKGALSPTATRSLSALSRGGNLYKARNPAAVFVDTGFLRSRCGPSHRFYSADAAAFAAPPPPKPRSRVRRALGFTSIAVVAFIAGFVYPNIRAVNRIMATPIPTDEETLTLFVPEDEFSREVDNFIKHHPLSEELRANPLFTESRPHLKIPESMRGRNLTAGTLSGRDKVTVPPYFWSEKGGKSMVSIFHLGSDICGHPGIVHGGMLATILDEGLARCCFPALPNGVGVTANLNIDYRRPAPANSYAVLRAETTKVEGRKAWVEGRIETLPEDGKEPVVLVEAKALFIEPKGAANMPSVYKSAASS